MTLDDLLGALHQAGVLDSDDNPIVERWGTLGPASADVAELRYLLDLTDRFDNNDQRARYLLTSNWLRDNGARLSVLAGGHPLPVRTASDHRIGRVCR